LASIAVLSVTRDRLAYTKHCFSVLQELAGCDYDHYVFDNGSGDGTQDWLRDNCGRFAWVIMNDENAGISHAMNALIAKAPDYDVYVKFDNDCELTVGGTLATAAQLVHDHPQWILSPKIEGLDSPPGTSRLVDLDGHRVGQLGQIGGIFMAIPGRVFGGGYRYDEGNPKWGMDDVTLGGWFQGQGGSLGYLMDMPAWHFKTTRGQWADPEQTAYYERKAAEFG
jgi:glycosyltransferase involved in cell wall biosynthesis